MPTRPVTSDSILSRKSVPSVSASLQEARCSLRDGSYLARRNQKGFSFGPPVHVTNAKLSSGHLCGRDCGELPSNTCFPRVRPISQSKWLSASRNTRKCTILGYIDLPSPMFEVLGKKQEYSSNRPLTRSSTQFDLTQSRESRSYSPS